MPRGTLRQAQGAPPSGRPGLLGPRRRPRGSGSACGAAAQPRDSGWARLAAARAAARRLLCRETGVEGAGGVPGRPGELPYANRGGAVPYEASGCTTEKSPSSKSLRAADRRGHSPFSEAGDCCRDRQSHYL